MFNWQPQDAHILVVDDNLQNVVLLKSLLQFAGYNRVTAEMNSTKAAATLRTNPPDLLILDLHMPAVSGFDILRIVSAEIRHETFLPVLVSTADWTEAARKRALDLGASDFVTKPFDASELLLRVRNFLDMRRMHVQLTEQNRILEDRVMRRTRRISRARTEALGCLARAGEFRDDVTGAHAQRVGHMSAKVARALGLSPTVCELIGLAAPLHDLGKIGIQDSVLLKKGHLTPVEFEAMKEHVLFGATIIGCAKSPLLRKAREIALYHHENWDGTGYPHGIAGARIPISARIVAIADTFDALIHERPYKLAWSRHDALAEIRRLSGTRFDPEVVRAFLAVSSPDRAVVLEDCEPALCRIS